jgi:phospholipase C
VRTALRKRRSAKDQTHTERQNKIMKSRQLLIELVKRAAAVATAAAIVAGPTGLAFADPPNHERQKSEHAVQRLRHIIVIYQENWSFDSLYGQFPGANGLQHVLTHCGSTTRTRITLR